MSTVNDSFANYLITKMQILFHCSHCFGECKASPSKDRGLISCPRCKKQLVLHYSDLLRQTNMIDACAVCQRRDLYVRDEARKAWGLLFPLLGLVAAYWTYGISLALGGYGFYWHFVRFPKLTVCYHCYAKYRNSRVNPEHHEYDLEKMESFERAIRNDRTSRDFR